MVAFSKFAVLATSVAASTSSGLSLTRGDAKYPTHTELSTPSEPKAKANEEGYDAFVKGWQDLPHRNPLGPVGEKRIPKEGVEEPGRQQNLVTSSG